MKTLALVLLCGMSVSAFAQDRDHDDREQQYQDNRNYQAQSNIPENVNRSFRRDHPYAADNAQWDRSGRSYHTRYQDRNYSNRNVDDYYDRRGRVVDRHVEWNRDEMPTYFDNNVYNRYHTHDYRVYRVERPGYMPVFQLLLDLAGGGTQTVYVDEYGNAIRYRDRH